MIPNKCVQIIQTGSKLFLFFSSFKYVNLFITTQISIFEDYIHIKKADE